MQDMRVNDQITPYPADEIVNDFLDMQSAELIFGILPWDFLMLA